MGLRDIATNRKIVGIPRKPETLAILRKFPHFSDPGPSDCVLDFGCGFECPAGQGCKEAWPEKASYSQELSRVCWSDAPCNYGPTVLPTLVVLNREITIFYDVRPSLFLSVGG